MKEYIYEAEIAKQELSSGKRLSGRDLNETRDINVELNTLQNADGSVILTLGKTKVVAGVKFVLDKPYPDSPDEGSISVGVELSAMADPTFGAGPPDETSIELSRVVDRGIRESKGIDFKSLCVKEGEHIWVAFVDVYIMNNDGNLFDACSYAALTALKNARIPKLDEEFKIVKGEYEGKLEVTNDPLLFTFVKIDDKIVLDPDLVEEAASSARFSVAITNEKNLVALQKGLAGAFKVDEIKDMVSVAIKKYSEIEEKILKAVKAFK